MQYHNIKNEYKSYEELLLIFKDRNMKGIDEDSLKNIKAIQTIGYYKIKEYGYPFFDRNLGIYPKLSFKEVIDRYYRDQSLKQEIFQIITDIEASLNSQLSNVLGEKDSYDYL